MAVHPGTSRSSRQQRICRSTAAAEYLISAVAALTLYGAYAQLGGRWANAALIAASAWFFFSLPLFARASNWLHARVAAATGSPTLGRLARLVVQWCYNLALYHLFLETGIVERSAVGALGGAAGGALLTTVASNGFQFIALGLADRGFGRRDGNVTLAICLTVLVTALAVHDVPAARPLFIAFGAAVTLLTVLFGASRELRSVAPRKWRLP